jgi:hypothetical protein
VASESITLRFPSGAWEYVITDHLPDVGDTLTRDGKTWLVARVADSVDHHRVISMEAAPRSGAAARPTPSGQTS